MKNIWRNGLLLSGLAFGALAPLAHADDKAQAAAQKPLEKAPLTITDRQGHRHDFTIEIARTEKEKEVGESLRKEVPEGTGMLFLFTPPEAASIWMRDTPVSLDIAFIGADGKIQAIEEKTVPFSERRLGGKDASAAVLEAAGGTMEKAGIVVGDLVSSKALATAR